MSFTVAVSLAAFDRLELDATRGRKAKRKRGKPKLRDHERIRWWAKAAELAGAGDEAALAAMMCLDGGLRSGEVLHRQVRDVEQGGKRLVIEGGKTEDSDRSATFCDQVAALVANQIEGRAESEPLIRSIWFPRCPQGPAAGRRRRRRCRVVMSLVQAKLGHRPSTAVTKDHDVGVEAYEEAERLLARATIAGKN